MNLEPLCFDLDLLLVPRGHEAPADAALLIPGEAADWYVSRPLVAISAPPHFPLHAFTLEPVPCAGHQVAEPGALIGSILLLLSWWIKHRWL